MIKIDMEMPKSCDVCSFCVAGRFFRFCNCYVADCYLLNVEDYEATRHPDCPLIEVLEDDCK